MAGKVVLTYFNGRGKMESIRWLLTAAEVEFDEVFVTSREQYEKLMYDGSLTFQQLPLVEIDGLKLVQTKAILNYIADKYNLHGKGLKERVMINMYSEGLMDLMEMIMMLPFCENPKLDNIKAKANERYLPVFEKALTGSTYLVGEKLSMADVLLVECTLMLEEICSNILNDFPNIKCFQCRMTKIPAINRFLQPGSKRKPQPDDNYKTMVMQVFNILDYSASALLLLLRYCPCNLERLKHALFFLFGIMYIYCTLHCYFSSQLQQPTMCDDKAELYYLNGRGRMESIRWLLTAAGVDFDEVLVEDRECYCKLIQDGKLLFGQIPMVKIDGMELVQTRAIMSYIAEKYKLDGKDIKDRAMVNMYSEGLMDLMEMIMMQPFCQDKKSKWQNIECKAKNRYLPVYEKALNGSEYLVGENLSKADVLLVECTLMLEEEFSDILKDFPNIQSFKDRMIQIPAIKRFLEPGSKRKSRPDEKYVKAVMDVFQVKTPF
ncbi:uncharacterized protein KZ484_011166 [Pholidichthys leucotaenia]